MLLGNINHPSTYDMLLISPVWKRVLDWLQNEAGKLPEGEYEIQGRDIYAPISIVQTKTRESCLFEAHKKNIDVHFCISGGEHIEWSPVKLLKSTMEFDTEKDYCLYEAPLACTSLKITPGDFAIFFPEDAHMPKISNGKNKEIKKAVVKINTSLV